MGWSVACPRGTKWVWVPSSRRGSGRWKMNMKLRGALSSLGDAKEFSAQRHNIVKSLARAYHNSTLFSPTQRQAPSSFTAQFHTSLYRQNRRLPRRSTFGTKKSRKESPSAAFRVARRLGCYPGACPRAVRHLAHERQVNSGILGGSWWVWK
ncbi:hypothetical protein DFH06DRAFT_1256671 [Mycena polygramma]|nr:hypothetical protein DFH06DRAFT_1256671 [Mycena polygramma]